MTGERAVPEGPAPARRRWLRAAGALVLGSRLAAAGEVRDGGPFVPTPRKVVEAMLDLAGVQADDFVIDLGSGDGRIVLAAATRHGARGLGVDIDRKLVDEANAAARELGVGERVRFVAQDVHATDFRQATVLTLYLLPGMMAALRPRFLKELRPGTRIVSHDFMLGAWQPDRTLEIETPEKYDLLGSWTSNVYLWVVPADVSGTWQAQSDAPDASPFRLAIRQEYQRVKGTLRRGGTSLAMVDPQLTGAVLRFAIPRPDGGSDLYEATSAGNVLSGSIAGTTISWSARRLP